MSSPRTLCDLKLDYQTALHLSAPVTGSLPFYTTSTRLSTFIELQICSHPQTEKGPEGPWLLPSLRHGRIRGEHAL